MNQVSVIMPVFNCQAYLAEAIESILGQTLRDFEFVIINDGSTDGSLEVIQRYARQDPRIRVVSRENRGITRTRNQGLAIAAGEYVAIMDADDISLPDRLQRQADYLDANPECLIVTIQMELIDPEGQSLDTINSETTHDEIDAAHLDYDNFLVSGGYMARRQAMLAVGGYDERFALAEDRDLFLRLAERGRVACIPEILYRYRQHPKSVCHRQAARLEECVQAVVARAWTRRGLPGTPPPFPVRAQAGDTSAKDIHRKWGWWALASGNVAAARKHALKAVRAAATECLAVVGLLDTRVVRDLNAER